MLPTYLIVGAGKCGTSSLAAYIRQHPDVTGPPRKETDFFAAPRSGRELDEYCRSLGNGRARGEASPSYSMAPIVGGVPQRIRALVPDVRLIYIVGDPIRKFTGTYRETISLGREKRSLSQALRDVDNPKSGYLIGCRFGQQLSVYREHFPPEQILVLDQDDLRHHRTEVMGQVYEHVGVDPDRGPSTFATEMNTAVDQRDWPSAGRMIRQWPITDAFRRIPHRYRRPMVLALRATLSSPIPPAELTSEERQALTERLREDVALLRHLTRASLGAGWQI